MINHCFLFYRKRLSGRGSQSLMIVDELNNTCFGLLDEYPAITIITFFLIRTMFFNRCTSLTQHLNIVQVHPTT